MEYILLSTCPKTPHYSTLSSTFSRPPHMLLHSTFLTFPSQKIMWNFLTCEVEIAIHFHFLALHALIHSSTFLAFPNQTMAWTYFKAVKWKLRSTSVFLFHITPLHTVHSLHSTPPHIDKKKKRDYGVWKIMTASERKPHRRYFKLIKYSR